jgi:rhamnogalacturonan endolyase
MVTHFNSASNASLSDLYDDALSLSKPGLFDTFYDDIAQHIPGYVRTSRRGTFECEITLPKGAVKPVAILAKNGIDYQDNAQATDAFQYWADIDVATGKVSIPRVAEGTYRLTIYAEGKFQMLLTNYSSQSHNCPQAYSEILSRTILRLRQGQQRPSK